MTKTETPKEKPKMEKLQSAIWEVANTGTDAINKYRNAASLVCNLVIYIEENFDLTDRENVRSNIEMWKRIEWKKYEEDFGEGFTKQEELYPYFIVVDPDGTQIKYTKSFTTSQAQTKFEVNTGRKWSKCTPEGYKIKEVTSIN